jgi:YggT family protein
MASFVLFILSNLIGLMEFAIICSAVLSWLVAFEVINTRNRFVYQFVRFLDSVTYPLLAPFRKMIPPLGGMDISPIIALLVLQGINRYLLPMIFAPLQSVVG